MGFGLLIAEMRTVADVMIDRGIGVMQALQEINGAEIVPTRPGSDATACRLRSDWVASVFAYHLRVADLGAWSAGLASDHVAEALRGAARFLEARDARKARGGAARALRITVGDEQ